MDLGKSKLEIKKNSFLKDIKLFKILYSAERTFRSGRSWWDSLVLTVFAAQTDHLSSMPGSYVMEEKHKPHKLFSELHFCAVGIAHARAHTHKYLFSLFNLKIKIMPMNLAIGSWWHYTRRFSEWEEQRPRVGGEDVSCQWMKTNPAPFFKFVTEKREEVDISFFKETTYNEMNLILIAIDLDEGRELEELYSSKWVVLCLHHC